MSDMMSVRLFMSNRRKEWPGSEHQPCFQMLGEFLSYNFSFTFMQPTFSEHLLDARPRSSDGEYRGKQYSLQLDFPACRKRAGEKLEKGKNRCSHLKGQRRFPEEEVIPGRKSTDESGGGGSLWGN